MVGRLVEDMLRRTPLRHVAILSIGLAYGWGVLASRGRLQIAMEMSLAATFVLGPIAMLLRLQTPLISYLPVSRRQVWQATWLMSTLAPAALMTAMKIPATLVNDATTWSSLTLSAVMDLLYAGAGCALIALGDARRGESHLRWISSVLLVIGLIWPLVNLWSLPTAWLDVRPVHVLLFAAGLALTMLSAFHTPARTRARTLRPRPASSTGVVGPAKRDRLSGLPLLLKHELSNSLILAAEVLVTMLAVTYVLDGWIGRRTPLVFLADNLPPIFDSRPIPSQPRAIDFTSQFAWFALYSAAVSMRFPQLLRHLRVLPLGRPRLHALLLSWPVLVWSAIWLLLALVQRMTIGPATPVDLHLPMLFSCGGVSALGIAAGLRFTGWPTPLTAATLPLLIIVPRMVDMSAVYLLAIGMTSFILAAALNVSALSRSATYKRPDLLVSRTQGI
jgi:hypothetical protein